MKTVREVANEALQDFLDCSEDASTDDIYAAADALDAELSRLRAETAWKPTEGSTEVDDQCFLFYIPNAPEALKFWAGPWAMWFAVDATYYKPLGDPPKKQG